MYGLSYNPDENVRVQAREPYGTPESLKIWSGTSVEDDCRPIPEGDGGVGPAIGEYGQMYKFDVYRSDPAHQGISKFYNSRCTLIKNAICTSSKTCATLRTVILKSAYAPRNEHVYTRLRRV